ncbi:MAG: VanW family protein [uncultured bacterium]|nr:MAG: VanW family protein [uncultured bacterium]HAU65113.1 hypothetical protein [Candidatus Woesebacteria bacterium]HCC08444.1 hypothetical protein [Candidatus Woesebacteria bacterium]
MASNSDNKMGKIAGSFFKKYLLRGVIVLGTLILIVLAGILSYLIVYNGKIYPNISVAGIKVGGIISSEASGILSKNTITPSELTLTYQDQVFKIKTDDINLSYDFPASANRVFEFTRTGNILYDLENRIRLLFYPKNFGLVTNISSDKLAKTVSIIAGQISIDPINPGISKVNGSIVVNRGSPGKEVDQERLTSDIVQSLSVGSASQISIPVDNVDNTLNEVEAKALTERAQKFLGKTISLKFEYNNIQLQDTDLFKLLDPKEGYKDDALSESIQKVAETIERDPQNPKFVFENGKVTEFQPSLPGVKIDNENFKNLLIEKMDILAGSTDKNLDLDIPVVKSPPEITTDKVNNLGIKELIGRGTSTYFHSIPNRVHNVSLAASRINGTLVKPGETFSFNEALGDVSAFTGYQQAYIISGGKTILGDGGGVCQVSTTLFRALLDAGLPIIERQAHAYRVGYYEQDSPPGLDATVYSPSPDLKFTNDTGNYVLIEASANPKNYSLVFELYGTLDGRVASVSKPIVTNVSSPPEDLYQDDPSLPTGTIKQIEYKAWGAKVTFKYVVTKNGQEIINKTFISNYKPWQAVYLRGTGPVN